MCTKKLRKCWRRIHHVWLYFLAKVMVRKRRSDTRGK